MNSIGGSSVANLFNMNNAMGSLAKGEASSSLFSNLIKDNIGDTIKSLRASEKISIDALEGKSSIHELVMALNHAETNLSVLVNVRDKFIASYQEITRMQI